MTQQRIPVTVVTGFLGAGKTTLLSKLVNEAKPRRLAILVNEFGEVSIDGELLRDNQRGNEVEIHDVAQGLIGYAEDGDFLPLMHAILAKRALIDHVLIETSGLALPTAVMEKLQSEELAPHFVLDAALAVVDTPLLLAGEFDPGARPGSALGENTDNSVAELFRQQLEAADIVVLNKIDEQNEDALLAAESRVRSLAPGVRFLELAWDARLEPKLALGLKLHEAAPANHHRTGFTLRPLTDQTRLDGHSHSGLGAHNHGLTTHKHFHEQDPGWQSFLLRATSAQAPEVLRKAVEQIALQQPILRVKGFAATPEDGRHVLIQGVRGRIEANMQASAKPVAQGQLVFIGYHPSRTRVAELLRELTGSDWK